MGEFYDSIPEHLITWIHTQQMFWVATAPLSPSGHINLSPKGIQGTFHIVDEHKVWYEDLTGSGVETISHVRENGRITIMFTAFVGPPRIVRLWGTGTVHEFGTPEYEALIPPETRQPGSRAAIVLDVKKVGSSCGYAVPYYDFKAHRSLLQKWNESCDNRDFDFEAKQSLEADSDTFAHEGMRYWQHEWNLKSMDGLPGLQTAHKTPLSTIVRDRPPSQVSVDKTGETGKGKAVSVATRRAEQAKLFVAFLLGLFVAIGYSMLMDISRTAGYRFDKLARLYA